MPLIILMITAILLYIFQSNVPSFSLAASGGIHVPIGHISSDLIDALVTQSRIVLQKAHVAMSITAKVRPTRVQPALTATAKIHGVSIPAEMSARTELRQRKADSGTVFVTVGTTKFDSLIRTLCTEEILSKLKKFGYAKVLLQIGAGEFVPDSSQLDKVEGLSIEYYRFKPTLQNDTEAADLVISHAGAGSCLETLNAGKPLLVVVNDELMGNHQTELAYQLYKDNHLYYCNCRTLAGTLDDVDFSKLEAFPAGKPHLFVEYLDNMLGFV